MTRPVGVSQADLKRASAIAKAERVMVEIEAGGKIFRVSPDIPEINRPSVIDGGESYGGNSLSEWRARHEGKAGGNPSRLKTPRGRQHS